MTNFKQKNEKFLIYAQNRLTNRLELKLEQIKLKCNLINLNEDEIENDEHDTKLENKFEHKFKLLKKLNEIHLAKRISFQNRVCFFETFIKNNVNQKRKADKSILLNKILLKDMEHKRQQKKIEVILLDIKRNKLANELKKYEKFSLFINQSLIHFNKSSLEYQDIEQTMNRYESLILMIDDTKLRLENLTDALSKIKIEFSNVIQNETDQFVRDHDMRQRLKSELNNLEIKNSIFNENFNKRIDLINKKTVEFNVISQSINNIYDLLNKKLTFRTVKKENFLKKDFTHPSDLKSKLRFIVDKLNDLKEISLI